MRIRQALLSATVSAVVSITLAPPAHAQGFFQKLFGFGDGAPSASVRQMMPRRSIPAIRYHAPQNQRRWVPGPAKAEGDSDDDDIGPPDSAGPYRTMCVRTCDGYYFPLRHEARHKNFAADLKSCRVACGDGGRLFYYREIGGSPETMVDLSGAKYSELPHAFEYRKKLVNGCACKPVPWSGEEAARHQSYAVADAALKAQESPKAVRSETAEASVAAEKQLVVPAPEAPARAEILPPAEEPAVNAASGKKSETEVLAKVAAQEAAPKTEPAATTETFELVRPQVEKAVHRRRTPRLDREQGSASNYKTTSAFGWIKPSKTRLVWPGDSRR